jgi:hypothetical protein
MVARKRSTRSKSASTRSSRKAKKSAGPLRVKFADRVTARDGVVQQRITHIVRRSDDGSMTCRSGSPNEHGPDCPVIAAISAFLLKYRDVWELNWRMHSERGVILAIVGSPNQWVRVQRSVM